MELKRTCRLDGVYGRSGPFTTVKHDSDRHLALNEKKKKSNETKGKCPE